MQIPVFKYFQDPILDGVIEKSDTECICCEKSNGLIYTGPVYSEEEYDDQICPWCIANGDANTKLGVKFLDFDGIGGYGQWDSAPQNEKEEIECRTPGFRAWQQEQWWTHCNSVAQYVGRAGKDEVKKFGENLRTYLINEAGLDGDEGNAYADALHKDGSPTAYLFRCTKCGLIGGYSDCN